MKNMLSSFENIVNMKIIKFQKNMLENIKKMLTVFNKNSLGLIKTIQNSKF